MSNLWQWRERITPARWLSDAVDERRRAVVARAQMDVGGVIEIPPGSNRSPYIDECLRMAGVPTTIIVSGKGWWCAAVVGRWLRDCGLAVPSAYASCDSWGNWNGHPIKQTGLPGDLVLYGAPTLTGPVIYQNKRWDATHIGVVARWTSYYATSYEGNAAWSGHSANGEAVVAKKIEQARVIGYVSLTGD